MSRHQSSFPIPRKSTKTLYLKWEAGEGQGCYNGQEDEEGEEILWPNYLWQFLNYFGLFLAINPKNWPNQKSKSWGLSPMIQF